MRSAWESYCAQHTVVFCESKSLIGKKIAFVLSENSGLIILYYKTFFKSEIQITLGLMLWTKKTDILYYKPRSRPYLVSLDNLSYNSRYDLSEFRAMGPEVLHMRELNNVLRYKIINSVWSNDTNIIFFSD